MPVTFRLNAINHRVTCEELFGWRQLHNKTNKLFPSRGIKSPIYFTMLFLIKNFGSLQTFIFLWSKTIRETDRLISTLFILTTRLFILQSLLHAVGNVSEKLINCLEKLNLIFLKNTMRRTKKYSRRIRTDLMIINSWCILARGLCNLMKNEKLLQMLKL